MRRPPVPWLVFVLLTVMLGGCGLLGQKSDTLHDDSRGTSPQVLGTLKGRVVDATSHLPLKQGQVTLEDGTAVALRDGTFTVSGLKPGRYQVTVSSPYHHPKLLAVLVPAGEVVVDVQLTTVFSDQELYDLASVVRAEAEGEPMEGQVAVAASVLNRWRSPDYPNNLSEIIYQVVDGRYQYSPVLDGRIRLGPNASSWQAVYRAVAGEDPSLGATGFFAHDKVGQDSWVRQWPVTTVIANHTFFIY